MPLLAAQLARTNEARNQSPRTRGGHFGTSRIPACAGTNGMVKLGLMMKRPLATLLLVLLIAAPARAAQCGGDFSVFLSAKAREAQAAGLPRGIIEQAFAGV